MLRRIYIAMLLLFASLGIVSIVGVFAPTSVGALTSVPAKMNFQGRLTNTAGNTLPNGTYNMRFRIYNAASGGSALWTESRLISASAGVTVTNGLFSVQLGDNTPIPSSLFLLQSQGTLYFEIELPTPATATTTSPAWTEGAMAPRNQLAASAYAFNSESLDGLDSAAFAQVGAANTFTAANNFKNSTNSTTAFSIQDSSGTSLLVADTTNDRLYIGSPATDANITFLAMDTYNGGSGNPAGGFPGAMYYNSVDNKFRCYEATYWLDCIPKVQVTGSATTVPGDWNATATKAAASTILVSPIYLPAQITVNQMRLRVTTALGAAGDIGIYDASTGNRILNGGSGSVTTAVGVKTIAPVQTGSSRLLFPGMYFVAITWNSVTGVIAGGVMGGNGLKYNGTISTGGGLVLPTSFSIASITEGPYIYASSIND